MALGITIFLFAGIVYVIQSSESLPELDTRLQAESDLVAALLGQAYQARDSIVERDPLSGRSALIPSVASFLEGVPGFVIILGLEGELFMSSEARALPFAAVDELVEAARPTLQGAGGFAGVTLTPGPGFVRLYGRPVETAGPLVTGILSAVPTAGLTLRPGRLLRAMLLTAPVVILASWFIGYFLVGRTLEPVDHIVDEVRAISDGRSLHRRLAVAPTQDELGRLTNTLNEMFARLERSFASLRRFTADASHELKTPLTVLRAGIERAITHPRVPRDVLETLEETLIEVNRMSELVDSLLTLARADEGRAPLHLDQVDFRDILSELEETASMLGEQAGVAVEVSVPREPIVIQADRDRIRQLFMNLLTNAIKYTPAGGNVVVSTSVHDGRIVVDVRDSGIGIAPGDLPHIFDRFWRADPARSRTGARPGPGLGLAISKWTAEAHGGSIGVQSRPGRGTTFTVELPVHGPAADSDS
jgi:signal transduction histidine kinase